MNKKGLTQETMLMIVGVLFLLVLGFVIQRISEITDDERKIKMCQATLLANDKIRKGELLGVETGERVPINCPKDRVTISMDDLDTWKGIDEEIALKYLLAEQLSRCKKKTSFPSVGELKPFDVKYFDTRTRFCLYCSEIQFEDDVKNKIPRLDGFIWFLSRQKMDDGKTYLEYIKGVEDLTAEDYQKMKEEGFVDIIETKDNYAVTYAIEKTGYLYQTIISILTGGTATAVGCYIGTAVQAIPIIGNVGGALLCGGSFVVGTAGGYFFGEKYTDEVTSYSFVKRENVENLACDSLYR